MNEAVLLAEALAEAKSLAVAVQKMEATYQKRINVLLSRVDKMQAALDRIASIPVPEGHIIQMPCKACKKRVKLAQKALKGSDHE